MRYVPVLKAKQGELRALHMLAEATLEITTPLLELVPSGSWPDDSDAELRKLPPKLAGLGQHRVLVDTVYLDQAAPEDREVSYIGQALDIMRDAGLQAAPVTRLSDPVDIGRLIRERNAAPSIGAAIRVTLDDLIDLSDGLPDEVIAAAQRLGMDRAQVDMLVDLAEVNSERDTRILRTALLPALRSLDIGEWRTVAVISGAFPADLRDFAPWTLDEVAREDAALWSRLRADFDGLSFGDYAVSHPALSLGVPFAPPPQLRYAAAGRWLVLKGSRRDPRGHQQFHEICREISRHSDFAGSMLGPADASIVERGQGLHGPGNASTWRMIGTAHHLDLVAARLTTQGEP